MLLYCRSQGQEKRNVPAPAQSTVPWPCWRACPGPPRSDETCPSTRASTFPALPPRSLCRCLAACWSAQPRWPQARNRWRPRGAARPRRRVPGPRSRSWGPSSPGTRGGAPSRRLARNGGPWFLSGLASCCARLWATNRRRRLRGAARVGEHDCARSHGCCIC